VLTLSFPKTSRVGLQRTFRDSPVARGHETLEIKDVVCEDERFTLVRSTRTRAKSLEIQPPVSVNGVPLQIPSLIKFSGCDSRAHSRVNRGGVMATRAATDETVGARFHLRIREPCSAGTGTSV
jgi:hypothetical protein